MNTKTTATKGTGKSTDRAHCTHIYQLNAHSRYKKCIKCHTIKKDI